MKVSAAFTLERRLDETCKTLCRRIAAKIRMHFTGSLKRFNRVSEDLLHERFF